MNLQENIHRIKDMMGLITEDQNNYENKPIVFVGPAGAGMGFGGGTFTTALGAGAAVGAGTANINREPSS